MFFPEKITGIDDHPQMFYNPETGNYERDIDYLSGDIAKKIDEAERTI